MPDTYVGESVLRLEDEVLLTGSASFVDDFQLDGMLQAAFVRSPVAHARITSIDVATARAVPGVAGVYTIEDLRSVLSQDRVPENFPDPGDRTDVGPYVLARDEVCYVGEAVVMVVAENRYVAEDAAQLVVVEYDALPVLCDPRDSSAPGAPAVDTRQDRTDNLETSFTKEHGDCAAAFAGAAHVVKLELTQQPLPFHECIPFNSIMLKDKSSKPADRSCSQSHPLCNRVCAIQVAS